MASWFSISVIGISAVLFVVTYFHLKHELRFQRWERNYLEHHDYITHGRYTPTEIDDIAGHVVHISLLLSVPFILLAIGIGWYLANKSIRPIAAINEQLRSIQADRLDMRIHAPDADTELEMLEKNINALLSRIEESYRDVSAFSARVAHELKTPLTLMRLQLEESAHFIEPEMSESLQNELMRLEGYVEQCLLIARAERGQIECRLQQTILKTLLEDILEPFCLLAKEESRRVKLIAKPVSEVSADPWIVRHVLHNLLSNALKHGSGDLVVELRQDQEMNCMVRISNALRKDQIKGTGLGLRIVDALVKTHGNLEWKYFLENEYYVTELRWKECAKKAEMV